MAEARFWAKVDKNGPNGCWEWSGSKGHRGHALLWCKNANRSIQAHRYIWELINGPISEGLVVRHKCRGAIIGCTNPEHLELGTNQQNQQDRIRDGTDVRGEKQPTHKLTIAQVKEIRARANEGCAKLAREFNVGATTTSSIINRKSWAWLD